MAKQVWVSEDGLYFDSEAEANNHEKLKEYNEALYDKIYSEFGSYGQLMVSNPTALQELLEVVDNFYKEWSNK